MARKASKNRRRMERTKRARRSPQARQPVGHRLKIVAEDQGKPRIAGDPDLTHLQGYGREIRRTWWDAYLQGVPNPYVMVIHKNSLVARQKGLASGVIEFWFTAISGEQAVAEGYLMPEMIEKPNTPPSQLLIFATGDRVEVTVHADLTEAGLLGAAHFSPDIRQMMTDECRRMEPELLDHLNERIAKPWEYDR